METLEVSPFSERFMKTRGRGGHWAVSWRSRRPTRTRRELRGEAAAASWSLPARTSGSRPSGSAPPSSEHTCRHLRTGPTATSHLSYLKATVSETQRVSFLQRRHQKKKNSPLLLNRGVLPVGTGSVHVRLILEKELSADGSWRLAN